MASCLICYHIILYWVKVTSYENSYLHSQPQSYPWSRNCLENFSVLMRWMALSKCWNIVEFAKNSIKMKNCKTFYEALAVKLETTHKPSKPPTNYPKHPQASHTTHQLSTNQQNHLQTSQNRTNHPLIIQKTHPSFPEDIFYD